MHAFVIAISNYNYLTFIHALFLEEEKFALMSFEIKNDNFVHRDLVYIYILYMHIIRIFKKILLCGN